MSNRAWGLGLGASGLARVLAVLRRVVGMPLVPVLGDHHVRAQPAQRLDDLVLLLGGRREPAVGQADGLAVRHAQDPGRRRGLRLALLGGASAAAFAAACASVGGGPGGTVTGGSAGPSGQMTQPGITWPIKTREHVDLWLHGFAMLQEDTTFVPFFRRGYSTNMTVLKNRANVVTQLDANRACALGGSYGGYMMNWIEGRWPDRFKCIVEHDGVFDARAMAYETEELWFDEWEHGGKAYYEAPEEYEKWNPVNHVADWKTPFREGVVYYLKAGRVRGVLLWNTWGQVEHARVLIAQPGPFRAADLQGRLPA